MKTLQITNQEVVYLSMGLGFLLANGNKALKLSPPVENKSDLVQAAETIAHLDSIFNLLTKLQLHEE